MYRKSICSLLSHFHTTEGDGVKLRRSQLLSWTVEQPLGVCVCVCVYRSRRCVSFSCCVKKFNNDAVPHEVLVEARTRVSVVELRGPNPFKHPPLSRVPPFLRIDTAHKTVLVLRFRKTARGTPKANEVLLLPASLFFLLLATTLLPTIPPPPTHTPRSNPNRLRSEESSPPANLDGSSAKASPRSQLHPRNDVPGPSLSFPPTRFIVIIFVVFFSFSSSVRRSADKPRTQERAAAAAAAAERKVRVRAPDLHGVRRSRERRLRRRRRAPSLLLLVLFQGRRTTESRARQ